MDDAPPIAEDLVLAVTTALIRKGLLDESDIEAICVGLSEDAAHAVRCCVVEAAAPKESDWRAERARERFRVVGSEE